MLSQSHQDAATPVRVDRCVSAENSIPHWCYDFITVGITTQKCICPCQASVWHDRRKKKRSAVVQTQWTLQLTTTQSFILLSFVPLPQPFLSAGPAIYKVSWCPPSPSSFLLLPHSEHQFNVKDLASWNSVFGFVFFFSILCSPFQIHSKAFQ